MAADHADNALYSDHYDDQLVPVLCADPAADFRRTESRHGYDNVLYLLYRFQAVSLWLRKCHGCHSDDYHCGTLGHTVQAWRE